ncbi:hypothetical protein GCK32_015135 [Trichostrongylus colubriformis]|uniref:Uncharacterized protein n=1 Tax=Trichostrongylus colubriformis TaxID=6319 RepID=A0AAN8GF85_TRICO
MSDDKLTSPEARRMFKTGLLIAGMKGTIRSLGKLNLSALVDSFVATDPHSTRPLHSSTLSPDSPRPIEAEETAIVEDRT